MALAPGGPPLSPPWAPAQSVPAGQWREFCTRSRAPLCFPAQLTRRRQEGESRSGRTKQLDRHVRCVTVTFAQPASQLAYLPVGRPDCKLGASIK